MIAVIRNVGVMRFQSFLTAFAVLYLASFASVTLAKSPIVVELFTSQGCSSCPPADEYFRELASRSELIALGFHVDYWDYIGWKDPFGKREFTDRQHVYATNLNLRYVYTPQIIINGVLHEVGSDRHKIEKLLKSAGETQPYDRPTISLQRRGGSLNILVDGRSHSVRHSVFLVCFDRETVTEVVRGENSGRTIVNANVVRELVEIGYWAGGPTKYSISTENKLGNGGCAVLVQEEKQGRIVSAALLKF